MLPVILRNNKGVALATQNSIGLGGFWGWLAKTLLNKVADIVSDFVSSTLPGTGLGRQLGTYLHTQIDKIGLMKNTGLNGVFDNYQPSTAEAEILKTWNETKFLPFYKKVLQDLAAGISVPTVQSQISAINIAMARMMASRDYHKTNNTAGLSAGAIDFRLEFIQSAFDGFFSLIDTTTSPYVYSETSMWLLDSKLVDSQPMNLDLSPLVIGTVPNQRVTQYFARGLTSGAVIPPMTVGIIIPPTETTPGYGAEFPPVTTAPGMPPIIPTTPVIVNPVPPTGNPATNPQTPVAEKGFLEKYKVPLMIGAILLILMPDDKKKKKEN